MTPPTFIASADAARPRNARVRRRSASCHGEHLPGDLLFKNFGVMPWLHQPYDYDEIEYPPIAIRRMPPPPPGFDEMASDVWYPVGPPMFSEEFATFLLTEPRVREAFLAFHRELLDAQWWQDAQALLARGDLAEVLSYAPEVRFAPPGASSP
jgi:isocitrate dehydrogenase kinase/phosphatase